MLCVTGLKRDWLSDVKQPFIPLKGEFRVPPTVIWSYQMERTFASQELPEPNDREEGCFETGDA